MIQVSIRCGMRETTRQYSASPSVGELKADRDLRDELGFSDNVRVLVNGVEQPDYLRLPNGSAVTIETAANTKA